MSLTCRIYTTIVDFLPCLLLQGAVVSREVVEQRKDGAIFTCHVSLHTGLVLVDMLEIHAGSRVVEIVHMHT